MDSGAETPDSKPYKMRDLTSTLNLSRSTLIYYEDLGIIEPKRRTETSHRQYDDSDVFRAMTATLLKNVGVPLRDIPAILDHEPYSSEHFEHYRELLDKQAEYVAAQKVCLERLHTIIERQGQITLEEIEPHYIYPDAGEKGYGEFRQSTNLDTLIGNLPIGGFGAIGRIDAHSGKSIPLWGRTVAVRFAHLLPDFRSDGLLTIGGSPCVVAYMGGMIARPQGTFLGRDEFGVTPSMRAFMEEHRLEEAGEAFAPYTVTSENGLLTAICAPVRKRREGRWGRIKRAFRG